MPEQFNTLLIALLFVALIGSWLLINALVDLAARRFRRWLAAHWSWFRNRWPETETPVAQQSHGDPQTLA